jgi:hypothetical protein
MDLITGAQAMCIGLTMTDGFAAGKIGTSEFNTLDWYLLNRQSVKKPYPQWIIRIMTQNAGFWSHNQIDDDLDIWAKETLEALTQLDVVAPWNPTQGSREMEVLNMYSPKSTRVLLRVLEPYYTPQIQYSQLMNEGKIAVVSPFAKSITEQWQKRAQIFPPSGPAGPMWLPNQTLIAINAYYGPHMTGKNLDRSWSEKIRNAGPNAALDHLTQQVVLSGAKYAFVGIGCLSLILVHRLKKYGIVAIHTGGATQILFGVKGKRWANHSVISQFFNIHWINPSPEEVPSEASIVENGCYW